jgi:hypothetical protein
MKTRSSIAPMLAAIVKPPMPRRPSDKQMVKDHARMQKRHATESWVAGRMTTKEHNAIHARADHVIAGKHPRQFRGGTRRAPKAGDGAHNLTGAIDAGL